MVPSTHRRRHPWNARRDRENHYKLPGGLPDDVRVRAAHVVAMTSRFGMPIVAILLQGGCASTQNGPVVAVPSLGTEDSVGAVRAAEIEGYTDSKGSQSRNLEFSRQRAESVRTYLIGRGFPAEQVAATGKGADRPISDNSSAEGRANNRRVEIVVSNSHPKAN